MTICLPDEVAAEVRRRTKLAFRPLSTSIAGIVVASARPPTWPKGLVTLLTTGKGSIVEPEDPPPEGVEGIG